MPSEHQNAAISSQELKHPTQVSTEPHLMQESTTSALATELDSMANTTTTAAAVHSSSRVIQTTCDPQQRYRTQPKNTRLHPPHPERSSPASPLRSDIIFGGAIDIDTSTSDTRPTNMKKRPPTGRTSPLRSRSMTKAESFPAQDSFSPSPSSSSISRSSAGVSKSVAMTTPTQTLELVSTRSSTTGSSSTNTSSTATFAASQNIGRVRRAVNRIEEKILLNRQDQSSSSSFALIVGGKRPRSHEMDNINQALKYTRTLSHEGHPKRHARPVVTPTDGDDADAQPLSFRFPAGLDPSFPLGFVGQFLVPPQSAHNPATSPAGSSLFRLSNSTRTRSSGGCMASRANAPGLSKDEDTSVATIAGIAETLLRYIPTTQQTPPTLESLMSDPSIQNLRRLPLTTRSRSNTTHLSLPAINLPLPTENLRPPGNDNTGAQQTITRLPERVRITLTYHIEQQDLNNQHAILGAIDMEPMSSSYEQPSSSAPASSAAPRRSSRNRRPHPPAK